MQQAGDITVPGRKLLDIMRTLPEKTTVTLTREGEKVVLRGGRSRFTLSSLPASEFPVIEDINAQHTLQIRGAGLPTADRQDALRDGAAGRALLPQRHAARDRRQVTARSGDRRPPPVLVRGADLAGKARELQQIILPRKGVLELQRLLDGEGEIEIAIGTNHIRVQIGEVRFTSKLIDGKFPEYGRVIPARSAARHDARRARPMRAALQRTAILSNEKYRGVRLTFAPGLLTVQAHNPEQEEAEDQLEVELQRRGDRDRLQRQLSARCAGGASRPRRSKSA